MSRLGPPGGFWDGPRRRKRKRPAEAETAVWWQLADGRGRYLGMFLDGAEIDAHVSKHPGRGFWLTRWRAGLVVERWTLAVRLDGGVDWRLIETRKGGRRRGES